MRLECSSQPCSSLSRRWRNRPFNHPVPITRGIFTTDRIGVQGYNAAGDYTDDFGGTSSACPGAAGTAALILAANPDLTWQQVRDILKETAEKIDTANGQYNTQGHSKKYGYGKVDALKAVQRAIALKNAVTPPVTAAITIKITSALVNPSGTDSGKEKITIKNSTASSVDLTGWNIEVKGKKQILSGNISAGQSKTINVNGQVVLTNNGATINLLNTNLQLVHSVSYKKQDVKKGTPILF